MKKGKNKKALGSRKPHITRGSVFDDLDFSAEEAAVLKFKADLHAQIISIVELRKLSPRELERVLEQPQPRVSELLCGKLSKLSAEKLVGYLSKLDVPVKLATQSKKKSETKVIAATVPPQINVFLTINVTTQTAHDVGQPVEQITNSGSGDNVIQLDDYKKDKVAV